MVTPCKKARASKKERKKESVSPAHQLCGWASRRAPPIGKVKVRSPPKSPRRPPSASPSPASSRSASPPARVRAPGTTEIQCKLDLYITGVRAEPTLGAGEWLGWMRNVGFFG